MKDFSTLSEKVSQMLQASKRYFPLLFVLLLIAIYGFLVYQVQVLNNQQPSVSDVSTQSTTAEVPHIDQNVLNQLKSLQDNSVSVQSLFDSARSNPFNE